MLWHGIVWIIMQHLRSRSTFTLDALLTVINLNYKNLPSTFWWFINYHQYNQIICKKEYKFGKHSSNENKDKNIYKLNTIVDEQRFFS